MEGGGGGEGKGEEGNFWVSFILYSLLAYYTLFYLPMFLVYKWVALTKRCTGSVGDEGGRGRFIWGGGLVELTAQKVI